MNTIKRFVMAANEMRGTKKTLFLVACSLLFALPFMTKNFVSVPYVNGFCAIFGWCGLSGLFITLFDFNKTSKRVLCSLFCFFFAFYFCVYSWFVNLYPLDFAGLGSVESIGVIIIAETAIPFIHACLMTCFVFASYFAAKRVNNCFVRAALVGFGYVLGEFSQSLGTFAFPWVRLFVGQTSFPVLLQSASLFGSYFITFLMVLVNALLAMSLVGLNVDKKKAFTCLLSAVLIFSANLVFGVVRVNVGANSEKTLSAIVLQGNIPSGEKWSGDVDEKAKYLALAQLSSDTNADIAVMPETALPVTVYSDDGFTSDAERTLAEISQTLDAELFAGAFGYDDGKIYNSLFLFDKDGAVSKPYNKRNIVPFGEFLPYRSIIEKIVPSLGEINMLSSDISRGESVVPIETKKGKAACLICFDSIFPETARRQIKNGGEFIVIATNDSWYKTSDAIFQHADHAIMRGIENNVPVIRCANTGVSRITDRLGYMVTESEVNETTVISATVELNGNMTLYTRIGDIFVLVCFVSIVFVLIFVKNKKASSE